MALIFTPLDGLLVAPAMYATEALPDTSVTALLGLSWPALGSAVMLKFTVAFLTRLLEPSRTTTEIVELLLVWDTALVVNATTPGTACNVALVAVVATKVTLRVAAGLLPLRPEAVMMAGPAVVEERIVMLASPDALVFTGLAETAPRLLAKLTAEPATATPLVFQLTVTGCDVPKGMSVPSAGVVKVKLSGLMVSACVVVIPAPVAVISSSPATMAVITALTWPAPSVIPVVGAIVLPVFELKFKVTPDSALFAESFTLKVSVVLLPDVRALLPLTVTVVPVTDIVFVVVAASAVAVTKMSRMLLSLPRLSLAVTNPFASDTPLALMLLTNAEVSLPVEKLTVLPVTACFDASSTMADRSTVSTPEEAMVVLLANNCSDVTAGPVVLVEAATGNSWGIAWPEPHPESAANVAARKSSAEHLEISRFNKFWVTKNKFCTQASRSRNLHR
ncbi:MAG: hypothetical protein IH604_15360 [Burkholderiales bacterium]|nr:hypothetical protein [Burkholderiales bacterium]